MVFFVQDFIKNFEDSTTAHITTAVGDLVTFMAPIVTSLLIIYMALWGIAHLRGTINEPVKDGLGRILRVIIVVSFALNIGLYLGVIVNFFFYGPDQLASVVAGASPGLAGIDAVLEKGLNEGFDIWNEGGILNGNVGLYFVAIAVWMGTVGLTAYCAFLLLISKAALTVLLALGPIFIVLLLFEATKRFFEMWFAQIANFAIMVILATSLIKIMLGIFEDLMDVAVADPSVALVPALYIVAASIIAILVLRQVPMIATALGGGLALSTQGFVSQALRSTPITSWLMTAANPTTTARGITTAGNAAKRASTTTAASAGNLYRRRFGANSITGR